MPEQSIDSVITDPPYGLRFMGKDWDHGVPGVLFWQAALRVAKPGAFLLAFGGTRTFHRLTCGIEDAGWEIRDCLLWLYGSGFPKGHDISKAIDKAKGQRRKTIRPSPFASRRPNARRPGTSVFNDDAYVEAPGGIPVTAPSTDLARQWQGWNTALKPAWEPICVAMKPLDGTFAENAERHGVAGLNVNGCRIGITKSVPGCDYIDSPTWLQSIGLGSGYGPRVKGMSGMDPDIGRWPANVVLDEEAAAMLDEQSGITTHRPALIHRGSRITGGVYGGQPNEAGTIGFSPGDTGGASRFFYCAKASRAEREAGLDALRKRPGGSNAKGYVADVERGLDRNAPRHNHHPTVKPLALMEWLCRLTATPTGGTVLDPFCGSGTTGMACVNVGRPFVGIEIDEGYCEIARARIAEAERRLHAEVPLFVNQTPGLERRPGHP